MKQITQKSERASLTVSKATKERLSMIGRIDQSYDDLINQLVDCWEEVHKKK